MDKKSYEKRLTEFQEELHKLCAKYDIEIIATLAQAPAAIIAQIRLIDMTDDELIKRYGLERVKTPEKQKNSSLNPSRN